MNANQIMKGLLHYSGIVKGITRQDGYGGDPPRRD